MEPKTWSEPLTEDWHSPLILELQPAVEEWSSESLLPEHELSSLPGFQELFLQESANQAAPGTAEEYWKESGLPW